ATLGSPGTAVVTIQDNETPPTATYVWISHLYQDLLLRNGSDAEITSWVNLVNLGVSRPAIVNGFLYSPEYRTRVVQNLYQTLLRRNVDAASLNGWVLFLATGTPAQMRAYLTGSAEYFQRVAGNSNAGFVHALYRDALNRDAGANEVNTWVNLLNRGMSR